MISRTTSGVMLSVVLIAALTAYIGVTSAEAGEARLFGHTLAPPEAQLLQDLQSVANSRSVSYAVVPDMSLPGPPSGGSAITRFTDAHTITTNIKPDLSAETFSLALAEEMTHALQNLASFPKLTPARASTLPTDISGALTTTLADVDAHDQMRKRGISTRSLGMEWLKEARHTGFQLKINSRVPVPENISNLAHALLYVQYWYAFREDPAMPRTAWSEAARAFGSNSPTTIFGRKCVETIERNGFTTPAGKRQMYRDILSVFELADGSYAVYEGPAQARTYYDVIQGARR